MLRVVFVHQLLSYFLSFIRSRGRTFFKHLRKQGETCNTRAPIMCAINERKNKYDTRCRKEEMNNLKDNKGNTRAHTHIHTGGHMHTHAHKVERD